MDLITFRVSISVKAFFWICPSHLENIESASLNFKGPLAKVTCFLFSILCVFNIFYNLNLYALTQLQQVLFTLNNTGRKMKNFRSRGLPKPLWCPIWLTLNICFLVTGQFKFHSTNVKSSNDDSNDRKFKNQLLKVQVLTSILNTAQIKVRLYQ